MGWREKGLNPGILISGLYGFVQHLTGHKLVAVVKPACSAVICTYIDMCIDVRVA